MTPLDELKFFRDGTQPICVVKAPPGSGKTQLLVEDVPPWVRLGAPVLITALTNEQVDEICRRLGNLNPRFTIVRFTSSSHYKLPTLPDNVHVCRNKNDFPSHYDVMVATVSKLALSNAPKVFPVMFVDEAWQIAFKELLPLTRYAQRIIMIGDSGQIPPVRTVPHLRWDTAPYKPGAAMPEPLDRVPSLRERTQTIKLSKSRRLPFDSVELVQNFYQDIDLDAVASPGERFLRITHSKQIDALDHAFESLSSASTALITVPTDVEMGLNTDSELAKCIAAAATRLLQSQPTIRATSAEELEGRNLVARDIGIIATHRAMNATIRAALNATFLDNGLEVDTPERWQGRERPVMLIAHPLSGIEHPSAFDLETGRLCVMASRHQTALLVFSRDHVPVTLDNLMPSATQSPGLSDAIGKGLHVHREFWNFHVKRDRIFHLM